MDGTKLIGHLVFTRTDGLARTDGRTQTDDLDVIPTCRNY
jgi:hypothetical protein